MPTMSPQMSRARSKSAQARVPEAGLGAVYLVQRTTFAYIYAAVEPGTDTAFALVLPEVSTRAMQAFLDRLAATLAEDEHVLLVLDRAGWHGANALVVPANITLAALPPRSPELNPVERDRKSTRLSSSHSQISYAVFC